MPQPIKEISDMNDDKPEDKAESTASCSGHIEPVVSFRCKNSLLNLVVAMMCLFTALMLYIADSPSFIIILNFITGALNLYIYKKAN